MDTPLDEILKADQSPIALMLATTDRNSPHFKMILRIGFAMHLCNILMHVTERGLIQRTPCDQQEIPTVQNFVNNLKRMKMVEAPSEYEHESRHLRDIDRALDRVLKQAIRITEIWLKDSLIFYGRIHRMQQEARLREEREQRIQRRREREAELRQAAKPMPTYKKTKLPHAEVEMCEKCHKRPVSKDHLCAPCLKWEQAKLGRE